MWALAGLAAGLGLVTYAVGQAGSFALTQRTDPSRATLDRNRYIGFGVLTAAGLAVAAFGKGMTASMLGAGVAAGGLMGLGGTELALALGRVVDKTEGPPAKLAGVFNGAGQQRFNGVFDGAGQQRFGAVFQPPMLQQMSGGGNMGATFVGGQQIGSSYYDQQYFGG